MENVVRRPDPSFWAGRRVLLTGHTGFKGSWLAFWLQRMGAHVTGLSLAPLTTPNLHDLLGLPLQIDGRIGDIRDFRFVADVVAAARPEVVLHLAAQALVRRSYLQPLETFASNVMGTTNVLESLRQAPSTRVAIMVTTDKVYRNREWLYPYREDDHLGGHDPYSASKAATELVVASYRDSFLREAGVAVASARAGNVIGGGDWSEDRLIPDAVRAWQSGATLEIRRPESVRPWQHVLEPLSAYLVLAEQLWQQPELAAAYNFGPDSADAASVRSVIEQARQAYGRGSVQWGDATEGPHEADLLMLDNSLSRHRLGIAPRWTLSAAVTRTMSWYRDLQSGIAASVLCEREINDYCGEL